MGAVRNHEPWLYDRHSPPGRVKCANPVAFGRLFEAPEQLAKQLANLCLGVGS